MATLNLWSYRKKGINAYLKAQGADHTAAMYGEPASPGDREAAYKSKLHEVSIDLGKLPDGTYEYKEAGGADRTKSRYGWIKVQGGEIVDEGEGSAPTGREGALLGLPDLTGSARQVAWATQLRDAATNYIWKQGWHGDYSQLSRDMGKLPTEAKWWIDNRSKDGSCSEAVRRFLGLEYAPIPTGVQALLDWEADQ
jgi:hypothetical protein